MPTYLTDPPALLTKNLLGVGGADDDVGDSGGHADLDTGVALLGQLALEELVQLGVEDTVGDELSALGQVGAGISHGLRGCDVGLHLGGWTGGMTTGGWVSWCSGVMKQKRDSATPS